MNPQEFCYWLQGYFEIKDNNENTLTPNQVAIIRRHLDLVFINVTKEVTVKDTGLLEALRNPQLTYC